MALVTLMARLGLDTSGFNSGLRSAESKAQSSAVAIGGAFKRAVNIGLGMGFLNMINQQISSLKRLQTDAKEFGIELDPELAKNLDRLTTEFAMLSIQVREFSAGPMALMLDVINGINDTIATFALIPGFGWKGAYDAVKQSREARTSNVARQAQIYRDKQDVEAEKGGASSKAEAMHIAGMSPVDRAQYLWGKHDQMMRIAPMMGRMAPGARAAFGRDFTGMAGDMEKYNLLRSKQSSDEVLKVLRSIEENTGKASEGGVTF